MDRILLFTLLALLLLPTPHIWAQEASEQALEIQDSGRDYLRAIRRRGIDADVGYYDPSLPPPPLTTTETPEQVPDENRERTQFDVDLVSGLISAAILAAIVILAVRLGGRLSLSVGKEGENASRKTRRSGNEAALPEERPGSLRSILRMRDRRAALILLARSALMRSVEENGVLFQSSWTARDALRHVPRDRDYFEALRDLVLAGERVQFGGRDIAEEEFEAHVARIKPLFGAAAS